MYSRLSLQSRIFIVLGTVAILTLLVIWTVVRPKYEATVISERLTIIQQLQAYSIENLDRTIGGWSDVTRFIAWQVTERPKEGEIVLRSIMTLHPEIIQITIQSPKLTDELSSQNTSYPAVKVQIKNDAWIRSKIDTLLQAAWVIDTVLQRQFFVLQTRFQVQNIPFILTVIWDAQRLHSLFTGLPLGENFSVSIQSSTAILVHNQSTFHPIELQNKEERMSVLQSVQQGNNSWRVLSSAFQTIQLWMMVAVPDTTILKPVNDLVLYSSSLILGLVLMLLVLGWVLSHQISEPIARLVKDVQRLSNLDFTQTIQMPVMRDLRGMGETIELMRQVLERYQRLNVEKIILEEWKNKLFITHSDDMIGFTDGTGAFVFRNGKLEDFCSALLPVRPFNSKIDVLTHPSIVIVKETVRDEAADSLRVHLVQSELKIELDSQTTTYQRVNDLSIIRNGDNLGSLLIFHDLTNERLIDKMKTEMINVVVHELRNPIASIKGFAEILLTDPNVTEEERKEFLGLMLTSTQNLSNLIKRFLDISRLESHRAEYPKVLTNIADLIKSTVEIQRPQILAKSLSADIEIKGMIPDVVVSPDLFREAISNLLSNAIKYGDPGRTITLSLMRDNGQIVFTIIDHGYGIPSSAQQKLFTKFFRVYHPKGSKEVGTGLGLAYVKEIVSYHQGVIKLESSAEIGCKFTISFPAVTQELLQNPGAGSAV